MGTHLKPSCSSGSHSHAAAATEQLLYKNLHQLPKKSSQLLTLQLAALPTECCSSIQLMLCWSRFAQYSICVCTKGIITAAVLQNRLQQPA